MMPRWFTLKWIVIAVLVLVIATGVASALTTFTRDVGGSVTAKVHSPDGIEVYLDEAQTQVANDVAFGAVKVDLFGSAEGGNTVPVWVRNYSLSTVRISAGDDFSEGEVAFDKNNATLGAGQTLAGELSMEFASEARGDFTFIISFRAEGPIAGPAPAATPTPGPVPSNITMTMVVRQVSEQFGDFEVQGYGAGSPSENSMGYFDHLLVHDGADPLASFVAEAWSVNTAGDELTLNIRKGVKFNTPTEFAGNDFGELTAHDVAWNMNRQNAVVNPRLDGSKGAQLGATFGQAVAVDDYTVKVPMVTDIFWGMPISEFDINDTSVRLDSKKAYDDMGAAAMEFVPVGSGPFTIGEWSPNDRGTVHAVPDHWREPPHIGEFVVIQVPDTTSRLAMMQTGGVDFGEIDFGRIRELDGRGLKFVQTMTDADTMTLSTIWPGNLWTDVNAKTGDPLEPWNSPVYEQDYPWLGCPWGDKCPYDDNDNPDGMSDMEQARLVRWALSMTIDRQGILDVLQGGLGTPIYLELMGPKFPGWQPDRTVTSAMIKAAHERYGGTDWPEYDTTPAEPDYEWPWTIPTDFTEAERLLDLAGYPKDSNGVRFDITLNKYACETGSVCLEQADAVAAGWESVGVKTTVLQEEYGAVVVPRMRDRTQAWPVVKNCSVETANYPFDWPPPASDSTFSRPAWGCAFESEFLVLQPHFNNVE